MNISEYSPKAFAIIGEKTKEYKEDLKRLGGKYNGNLKCGPGWIFPNLRKAEAVNFLASKGFGEHPEGEIDDTAPTGKVELESTFIRIMKDLTLEERFETLEKLVSIMKNLDKYKELEREGKKESKKKKPEAKVEDKSEHEEEKKAEKTEKKTKKEKKEKVEEKKTEKKTKKEEVDSESDSEDENKVENKPKKATPVQASKTQALKKQIPKKKSPSTAAEDSDSSIDETDDEIRPMPRMLSRN